MAQTRYQRPYSLRVFFGIISLLGATLIALLFTLGTHHPAPLTILGILVAVCIAGFLFDPDTAYASKMTLDDGTVVWVRRPLIGFKRLETKVGVTGGYEVRFDGWRHEEALFRI